MKKKLLVLSAIVCAFVLTAGCLGESGGENGAKKETYMAKSGGMFGPVEGNTVEGEPTNLNLNLNQTYITEVTFKLEWTDTNNNGDPEPANDDVFTMTVTPPNASEPARATGGGGSLSLDVRTTQNVENPEANGEGWNMVITIDAGQGSTSPMPGPFKVIIYVDDQNDWTLTATYSYLVAEEGV